MLVQRVGRCVLGICNVASIMLQPTIIIIGTHFVGLFLILYRIRNLTYM